MASKHESALHDLYRQEFPKGRRGFLKKASTGRIRKLLRGKLILKARKRRDEAYELIRIYESRLLDEFKKTKKYKELKASIEHTKCIMNLVQSDICFLNKQIHELNVIEPTMRERLTFASQWPNEQQFEAIRSLQSVTESRDILMNYLLPLQQYFDSQRGLLHTLLNEERELLEECRRDPQKFATKDFNADTALVIPELDTLNDLPDN